jgi:hypothetical protein
MADQLYFPPHQGLPYDYAPPLVDGFCEWEVGYTQPLTEQPIEGGWTGAGKVSYGAGGTVAVASMQAVRNNAAPYIYLSFLVRFGQQFTNAEGTFNFDGRNGIIIVLQDSLPSVVTTATPLTNAVRIIIWPLATGGGGAANSGDPGTQYTHSISLPSGTETITIWENGGCVQRFDVWDATTATWTPLLDLTVANPNDVQIRMRSWTGQSTDNCWSVEVKLPTTNASVTQWINLSTTGFFGLYTNIFEYDPALNQGTAVDVDNAAVVEFPWPTANIIAGAYASLDQIPIDQTLLGQASISLSTSGVMFDDSGPNGAFFVNVTGPDGPLTGTTMDKSGRDNNLLNAVVKNTGSATAQAVTAAFQIAGFGIHGGSPYQGNWALITPDPAATTAAPPATNPSNANPTQGQNVTAGDTFFNLNWQLESAPSSPDQVNYGSLGSDQCVLVTLGSTYPVLFTQSSLRTNTSFVDLSRAERKIHVSGKGYGPATGGATHLDFVIRQVRRLMVSTQTYDGWDPGQKGRKPDPGPGPGPNYRAEDGNQWGLTAPWIARNTFSRWLAATTTTYTWLVITVGYRRTDQTLTLGGRKHQIYTVADSCTHVLTHVGEVGGLTYSLAGPALESKDSGVFTLKVPIGGEVVLNATYEAFELGRCDLLDRLLALIDKLLALIEAIEASSDRLDPLHALLRKILLVIRFLPIPANARDALIHAVEHLDKLGTRLRVLAELRRSLQAIEHETEILNRILNKLVAIEPSTLSATLTQIYGAQALQVEQQMAAFGAKVEALGPILHTLATTCQLVQELAGITSHVHALDALVRWFERAFERLIHLGALKKRFPMLDKLLPAGGPASGDLAENIAQLEKTNALLDRATKILDQLAKCEHDVEAAEKQINAINYQDVGPVADRVYSAVFG